MAMIGLFWETGTNTLSGGRRWTPQPGFARSGPRKQHNLVIIYCLWYCCSSSGTLPAQGPGLHHAHRLQPTKGSRQAV